MFYATGGLILLPLATNRNEVPKWARGFGDITNTKALEKISPGQSVKIKLQANCVLSLCGLSNLFLIIVRWAN